jgi:hypothetical protein
MTNKFKNVTVEKEKKSKISDKNAKFVLGPP